MEAIQYMQPGERPTEPGWYVVDAENGAFVSEVSIHQARLWFEPSRLCVLDSDRFIARIFPERIVASRAKPETKKPATANRAG